MDNPSSTVRKAVCVGDYISLAATAPQEAYMHAQALVLTRLGARLTSGGGTRGGRHVGSTPSEVYRCTSHLAPHAA